MVGGIARGVCRAGKGDGLTSFKRKPFWITMAVIAFFVVPAVAKYVVWSGLWTVIYGFGIIGLLALFAQSWGSDYEGPDNEMYP